MKINKDVLRILNESEEFDIEEKELLDKLLVKYSDLSSSEIAERINNYRKSTFPVGSFAAWFGIDLTGQTYNGNINCSVEDLTSLYGCPSIVTGNFNCEHNQLTSLEGAPQKVEGDFWCFHNQLISLEGAPQKVGGDFDCSWNKLTSLQGAPQKVEGYFDCSHNQLTSLKGAPQKVGRSFYCKFNPNLKSLDGIGEVKGEIIS